MRLFFGIWQATIGQLGGGGAPGVGMRLFFGIWQATIESVRGGGWGRPGGWSTINFLGSGRLQ